MTTKRKPVQVYKSRGEYRWRVRARNGRILGASSEGYKHRCDCVANIVTLGILLSSATP